MKKGTQIQKVEIVNGHVDVFDTNNNSIKVNRTERNLLSDYRNKNYVEDVKKQFSNNAILADGFTIIKNGIVKFTYTK